MSYIKYKKALELIHKCEDYDPWIGQPSSVINKAEILIGINFSKQMKEYLANLGCVSFSGNEIYGIVKDNFDDLSTLTGQIVQTTLIYRKQYNLPYEWIPIYNYGFNGYYACLDYNQLNEEGEPPVIMMGWDGEKYFIVEKIAEDFGDFLLELAEKALENI